MKVLVVCARRYNGHELWTFLGVLQEAGIDFEVISTSKYIQDEVTNQPNVIARVIDDVPSLASEGFTALAFISGNMKDTEAYWDDPRTLAYVTEAHEAALPIAAICCSVPTIREAALGKKVSYFPLVRSEERLEAAGAICQTVSITVDGNLVTAEHQMATQRWAEAFVSVLKGEDPGITLVDSGFKPGGRLGKPDPDIQRLRDLADETGKLGFDD